MRALVVFLFCATALAQEAGQVPVPTPPRAATLNVQLKGTSKALVDSIHGTMFEKAQGYALFITGEKNRTVTCEVRSWVADLPDVTVRWHRKMSWAVSARTRC